MFLITRPHQRTEGDLGLDKLKPAGPTLILKDDLHPEDEAMVQALYSRSASSVVEHLQKIEQVGSGKLMDNYVVGYNHKSIADCGTTTLFLEGVSMLADKAIQDWPLYSGQETSTRYIDMSSQRIVDPIGTPQSKEILDRWMYFYTGHQDAVRDHVRKTYPQNAGEKDQSYEGAVKARVFDIMRGFLPAGITTQLSWHTNLRQAGDHLSWMQYHPLEEVRMIAEALGKMLNDAYPSSGFTKDLADVSGVTGGKAARAQWMMEVSKSLTYDSRPEDFSRPKLTSSFPNDYAPLQEMWLTDLLRDRPRGAVLPHILSGMGQLTATGLLDFGSFRDIQRHRNGACSMPLLTKAYGFMPWYLEQLPPQVLSQARYLLETQSALISSCCQDIHIAQYYIAMGYRVPVRMVQGLPALLYMLELRSAKTIHPTLRSLVHQWVKDFRNTHPNIALHTDDDPNSWDVRRGSQTITKKEGA